jgi:hypothetical protein
MSRIYRPIVSDDIDTIFFQMHNAGRSFRYPQE